MIAAALEPGLSHTSCQVLQYLCHQVARDSNSCVRLLSLCAKLSETCGSWQPRYAAMMSAEHKLLEHLQL